MQQQAAEAKIRDIFKAEFADAAKSANGKLALATKLSEQAEKTADDPTARFVLWRLASTEAAAGGAAAAALAIVDKMQAKYELDLPAVKADLLVRRWKARMPAADRTPCGGIFDSAMGLADRAVADGDFETASRFAKVAGGAGRKIGDPQFKRSMTKFPAIQKALETLAGDPADGAAFLVVGQWYCITKGDWEKGLPLLIKGTKADWADLAKRDLAKPGDAKEQVTLADAWWSLAEKETGSSKSAVRHGPGTGIKRRFRGYPDWRRHGSRSDWKARRRPSRPSRRREVAVWCKKEMLRRQATGRPSPARSSREPRPGCSTATPRIMRRHTPSLSETRRSNGSSLSRRPICCARFVSSSGNWTNDSTATRCGDRPMARPTP